MVCVVVAYRCRYYYNLVKSQHLHLAFIVASTMSSSPKQPYQSQINTLFERLDCQDARFDQLDAKIDKLTRAFKKLPMLDQPQTPPQFSPDLLAGEMIVVNGSFISQVEQMSLRRGNQNQ